MMNTTLTQIASTVDAVRDLIASAPYEKVRSQVRRALLDDAFVGDVASYDKPVAKLYAATMDVVENNPRPSKAAIEKLIDVLTSGIGAIATAEQAKPESKKAKKPEPKKAKPVKLSGKTAPATVLAEMTTKPKNAKRYAATEQVFATAVDDARDVLANAVRFIYSTTEAPLAIACDAILGSRAKLDRIKMLTTFRRLSALGIAETVAIGKEEGQRNGRRIVRKLATSPTLDEALRKVQSETTASGRVACMTARLPRQKKARPEAQIKAGNGRCQYLGLNFGAGPDVECSRRVREGQKLCAFHRSEFASKK